MMKYLPLLLLAFLSHSLFSQEDSIPRPKVKDSTIKKLKGDKPPQDGVNAGPEITIENYKIISHARDTTFLDTTLTIAKEYRYNFLRKDDFELMPFSNIGQPYNSLGVNFVEPTMYPSIGARAKHFNYFEVEDIKYYHVATPMTDLFFKTTLEQGQLLDAMLTLNTSKRFNYSIAFKGFRSLGKYQFNQAQSGNFRTTANYITKNGRYDIRGHIATQDLEAEENGGLSNKELQFESGDSEFSDRSRIDVFFTDAGNKLNGKRYFLDHNYKLIKKVRDSGRTRATSLAFGHQFNYESKLYAFKQTTPNAYFGDELVSPIDDQARLKTMFNKLKVEFSNRTLGRLTGYTSLYNYNYYFNSILITDTQEIPNQLKGEEIAVGADYVKQIGGFSVAADIGYNLSGDLTGNIINASASYLINEKNRISASLHSTSRMPNFNFLLYQSDYENYNWQNTAVFEKQKVYGLQFSLESQLWGNLSAHYTTLDNYTYFASEATEDQIVNGEENAFVKPFQENSSVNHLKLKYIKEFKFGNWALNNTFMYQNVSGASQVLNIPDFVTRNTLYYSKELFKKAMFVQTGVTLKYFTSYYMNAYNPLLGEFYVQNREELGGYPMLDFFVNAKIKQTRIYLKAEHFNSSFTGNNFYSAPSYPYRDFVIRFGLVWNFFS